jgi:hypothetical protein
MGARTDLTAHPSDTGRALSGSGQSESNGFPGAHLAVLVLLVTFLGLVVVVRDAGFQDFIAAAFITVISLAAFRISSGYK